MKAKPLKIGMAGVAWKLQLRLLQHLEPKTQDNFKYRKEF
jgi:hypothetical protein